MPIARDRRRRPGGRCGDRLCLQPLRCPAPVIEARDRRARGLEELGLDRVRAAVLSAAGGRGVATRPARALGDELAVQPRRGSDRRGERERELLL